MFPGGFIDGGKEANGAIVVGPLVKEVGEGANGADGDNAEPEIKNVVHEFIITSYFSKMEIFKH